MSQTAPPKPADGERLSTTEYIGYALGDTASNFFFQTFNIFLSFYYIDVWGIDKQTMLWLVPAVGIIGAIADPAMGLIADRTNTRWGKFRPYLLFGAIPYGICGFLMFAGPDLSAAGKVAYAFFTYALMLVCYSVINVPYSSMLGVISSSSRTRAMASTLRFVGAFSGTLLISLFVRPLVKILGGGAEGRPIDYVTGFRWTIGIFAVISVIMFWITFGTTHERVKPPPKQKSNVKEELSELVRNWPWVMLLFASVFSMTFSSLRSGATLFYFKYVVGDNGEPFIRMGKMIELDRSTVFLTAGAVGLVLGTFSLSSIVRKVDKKHCAAVLTAMTAICFGAFYFVPKDNFGLMLGLNVLAQFCAGPTSALTWALYGDVADWGEWKYGRRSTGLIYSASLFAIKAGGIAGGFLVPLFLQSFGFVRGAPAQTANALLGITLAFTLSPALVALLKAGSLLIYPLNQKRVDEVEKALASRRADASSENKPA
jgi:GPH family glycoside/pentoside/hexuronide:cation symporter